MRDNILVILAASKMRVDYATIFNTVPAMLPFNGKPLVYQVILNYIRNRKDRGSIFLALPAGEEHIEQFLQVAFGSRANLHCCYINNARPYCQADTLQKLLAMMKDLNIEDSGLLIANGDVYFELPLLTTNQMATAFVCNSLVDEKYSHYILDPMERVHYVDVGDKVPSAKDKQVFVDCGVYYFPSWKELLQTRQNQHYNCTIGKFLCEVTQGNLQLVLAQKWVDLGNLDSATTISTKVLGAREFNQLSIDEKRGLIKKSSENKDKILQEINYYIKLPHSLKIFFPRLYDFSLGKSVSYSIEYYPYKTLSEYYVMYELSEECWRRIFDKIFDVYAEFKAHPGRLPSKEQYHHIYIGKLFDRLEKVKEIPELYSLIEKSHVVINGQNYYGWKCYLPFIEEVMCKAYASCSCVVIHGDLCFSNILYEPSTNTVKFIDPRGEFFEEGVYGDPNYDLVKLMHSVHGGYDFIIHQMYLLEGANDVGYKFNLIQSEKTFSIKNVFLSRLHRDYNSKEIQTFLVQEAMLFLSMLPLHKDDLKRQKAFYLTALKVLKEAKEYC